MTKTIEEKTVRQGNLAVDVGKPKVQLSDGEVIKHSKKVFCKYWFLPGGGEIAEVWRCALLHTTRAKRSRARDVW